MLKQPVLERERVAVRVLHRRSRRRADVGQKQPGTDMPGQMLKVRVIPSRVGIAIHAGRFVLAVPADAESITVGRFDVLPSHDGFGRSRNDPDALTSRSDELAVPNRQANDT